jgi:hypothetical protein
MKLETSQDLLNRVRAKHHSSWYGLQKLMGVHRNTVYSWKGGHTAVDKKFAPRVAELIGEPAEYVLACLEAEREQSADVLKLWRRIAERFRSPAIILLASLVLLTVPRGASAAGVGVELGWDLSNCPSIHYAQLGTWLRRRLRKLLACLKNWASVPLAPPCAGNRSTASVPRSSRPWAVCTSARRDAGSAPASARAGWRAWWVATHAASSTSSIGPGAAGGCAAAF